MNKTLIIEYLYDVFSYSNKNKKDLSCSFKELLKNKDFLQMIENKPFDITKIFATINQCKKSSVEWTANKIRYLSFLISEFISLTSVNIKLLCRYIDPNDIFINYNNYHSQDINNVIFELFIKYNEKFKLRKLNVKSFSDIDKIVQIFIRLFPFNRFELFDSIFDKKLMIKILCLGNEILLFSSNIDELLSNDYFIQRYCVGNKVYCFVNEGHNKANRFNIYYFVISKSELTLITPGGLRHTFSFSN